jgi:hypothetical protein
MKSTSKVRMLTRTIMSLIGVSKSNITFKNRKDEYHKAYWLPKNVCNGIELVALIERTSKKAPAELLMKAGLSSYMDGKITEQIKLDTAARERNEKPKRTRFAFILRKYARERGMDISKFI